MFLSFFRLPNLVEYIKDTMIKSCRDFSPYVRRAAMIGCLQLYKLSPEQIKGSYQLMYINFMLCVQVGEGAGAVDCKPTVIGRRPSMQSCWKLYPILHKAIFTCIVDTPCRPCIYGTSICAKVIIVYWYYIYINIYIYIYIYMYIQYIL